MAPLAQHGTLWVKRTDWKKAQYSAVHGVDLQQTVDDFKACWVRDKQLGVDPSLLTLRLVKCGRGAPDAAAEDASSVLSDPSLSLREAGLQPTSWLLADFAGDAGMLPCAVRPRALALLGACRVPLASSPHVPPLTRAQNVLRALSRSRVDAHTAAAPRPSAAPSVAKLSDVAQLVRSADDPDVYFLTSAALPGAAPPALPRTLFLDPGGAVMSFLREWMEEQRIRFPHGSPFDTDSLGLFISGTPKARAPRAPLRDGVCPQPAVSSSQRAGGPRRADATRAHARVARRRASRSSSPRCCLRSSVTTPCWALAARPRRA
jgi:hypothetical protein